MECNILASILYIVEQAMWFGSDSVANLVLKWKRSYIRYTAFPRRSKPFVSINMYNHASYLNQKEYKPWIIGYTSSISEVFIE